MCYPCDNSIKKQDLLEEIKQTVFYCEDANISWNLFATCLVSRCEEFT